MERLLRLDKRSNNLNKTKMKNRQRYYTAFVTCVINKRITTISEEIIPMIRRMEYNGVRVG